MNYDFGSSTAESRLIGAGRAVLYWGGAEFPDRNAAAQRVIANALIFKQLGFRVLLLGVSKDLKPGSHVRRVPLDGIPLECWEQPYPTSAAAWCSYVISTSAIETVLREADAQRVAAIIGYNTPAVAQYRATRIARSRGGCGIADITEWYATLRPTSLRNVARNLDSSVRMRLLPRAMDALISTSPFLTDYYASSGKPVVELPTLQNESLPSPRATDRGAELAPKRLFFAGGLPTRREIEASTLGLKDRIDIIVDLLFRCVRMGSEFKLDIFGVTMEAYLEAFPNDRQKLTTLREHLVFHGRKPRDEVRKFLSDADFSIFFRDVSRVTLAGFPSKYAESVHFGTPVLTNQMPNLKEYHVAGRTGFYLDADDAAGASRRLVEILRLPQEVVSEMKQYCADSRIFDYRSFVGKVEEFVRGWPRRTR